MVCSFNSEGQYQSLGKWNGQQVRPYAFLLPIINRQGDGPAAPNYVMRKLISFLMLLTLGVASVFAAKKITINVIPETAKIYVDGQMVGTGSYQVKFDKNTDFFIVKVEAPGYDTETYRLRKDNPKNTVLYTLTEDEAMAASVGSDDGVDLANRWFDVTCKKGLSEDQVWKRLMSVCTNYFDNIEVRDKSAGWIKTAWRITRFKKKNGTHPFRSQNVIR